MDSVPQHAAPHRIGVFGGTFDPVHIGHLVVAVNVRYELGLDEVLFVVAGEPWQKTPHRSVTPAEDRIALVEAALDGVDGLSASRLEIDRPGPSYTADTLVELQRLHPGAELWVVLGADAAAGLSTWERLDEVRRLASVAVVGRPGTQASAPPEGWRWRVVSCPHLDVSSTDLRARVADGRPLDYLLPEPVIDRIRARNLYRRPLVTVP